MLEDIVLANVAVVASEIVHVSRKNWRQIIGSMNKQPIMTLTATGYLLRTCGSCVCEVCDLPWCLFGMSCTEVRGAG